MSFIYIDLYFQLSILSNGNSTHQINNNKAYKLLEDLEDLHIIKVLKKTIQPQQKLSEKYAGKLPSDIADELQDYVSQSRNEWNSRSI